MRNRVERLRGWLLGGAGLLVVVIAGFLGYARYLTHHFKLNLPARLGVDIVRETDGFTYSQSVQGKTVYTIHAAKAIEHKDGKIALHDVWIVLYGRTTSSQAQQAPPANTGAGAVDRGDRISGSDFEYDQKAGVVRAMGTVQMDLLASSAATVSDRPARMGRDSAAPEMLHVTTSGLVFLQKLGLAATSERIDFQRGDLRGSATGADYNTDTGVLVLHSAVQVKGTTGGRAVELTASRAELDRRGNLATLADARYGAQNAMDETVSARHAVVHTRTDGSVERVEAQGDVTSIARGGTLVCQRADVALDAEGHAQTAKLGGGLTFSQIAEVRQLRGQAGESLVAFDQAGKPVRVALTGGVHLAERQRVGAGVSMRWSVRDLAAPRVVVDFIAAKGAQSPVPRDFEATGGAEVTEVSEGAAASLRVARSELAADDLRAHFVPIAASRSKVGIDSAFGIGHTVFRQTRKDGVVQTGSGERLEAKFRTGARGASESNKAASGMPADLISAMQEGHVTMVRVVPPRVGAKAGSRAARGSEQDATAIRVTYDAATDRVALSGGVSVRDAGSLLLADRVTTDRGSGDSTAEGRVRVSYEAEAKPGAAGSKREPMHVLADRAEMAGESEVATFFGSPSKPARMWQAGTQVQAEVLELSQEDGKDRRLVAHGSNASDAGAVRTVLVSAGTQKAATAGSTAASAIVRGPKVVHIASAAMAYSDATREADFTGGVRVESGQATLRANEATALLSAAKSASPAVPDVRATEGMASLGASLERIVAKGKIELEEPGRRGSGTRLVYTAEDDDVVLTGDAAAAPKLVDTVQGVTTSGREIRFHLGDDSVAISGGDGDTAARAETRVKH